MRDKDGKSSDKIIDKHAGKNKEDLLAEVIANPDDNDARIRFAIWQEKYGDKVHGKFIRDQIFNMGGGTHSQFSGTAWTTEEARILHEHRYRWEKEAGIADAPMGFKSYFVGGFPEHLNISPNTSGDFATPWFFERLPDIRARTPITSLTILSEMVTNDHLKEVAKLGQLKILFLSSGQITDDGMEALTALKKLDTLYVTSSAVTDKGIETIAKMVQLRGACLTGTKVTDAGVKLLTPLRRLVHIGLHGTNVTRVGQEEALDIMVRNKSRGAMSRRSDINPSNRPAKWVDLADKPGAIEMGKKPVSGIGNRAKRRAEQDAVPFHQ